MLKGIVNGVEKDITRIPMKGQNLIDVANLSDVRWATQYPLLLNAINSLPNGVYTMSISYELTSRNDVTDNSVYGWYIAKGNTVLSNIREKWNTAPIGTVKTVSGTFTINDNNRGSFTALFLYGCGINGIGLTGSTNATNIMLNSGSTALPYEPYGYQNGWEIRDNQNRLIWGRENILEGTDSISFKGYGVPISTIEVDGNGQQNGTPTPDNPIIPEFCGDRTGNLIPEYSKRSKTLDGVNWDVSSNGKITGSGTTTSGTNFYILNNFSMPLKAGTYTLSFVGRKNISLILRDVTAATTLCPVWSTTKSATFTIDDDIPETHRIMLYFNTSQAGVSVDIDGYPMLNSGSTALPYEPYGYKIPFTCTEQTVPVYLGEVPTVRKIKKLVFDGTENWTLFEGSSRFFYTALNPKCAGTISSYFLCTHRTGLQSSATRDSLRWYDADTTWQDVASFKAWLADQYASGTPVTVWYVMETTETGIVNEPLCKIGNYYDTLTVTNQDVNIDIPEGPCLLTVDTTIPPSKLTVSIHARTATNWNQFRNYIRNGYGPIMYPVGTILYDTFGTETGTAYQVVAYDKHFDPSLTAQGYNHSVTLCEHLLEDIYVFDNAEAMLYVETAIPAGTYKFTIPNYDATYGGNKTYYFTSTGDVPVNSQITLRWDYQHLPQSVTAYAGPNPQTNTTALTGFNGLTLTEWVEGESPDAVDLGTVGGPNAELGTSNFGKMNHIQRVRYGSNNYLQSGVRQYINSSTTANTWWKPQTIFDRPYSQRTQNGKLMKLNQDMVSVLAKPEIQSRTNNYFETTSLDGTTFTLSTNYTITTDKMFLLSPMEVGFTTTDTTVGTTLDYYINATNDKRIKYRKSNNTAYYWWLRTPHPTYAYSVRIVNSTGALNNYTANGSVGVAPACIIQ